MEKRVVKLCELSVLGYEYAPCPMKEDGKELIMIYNKKGEVVDPFFEGFYVLARENQKIHGNYDWRISYGDKKLSRVQ